MRAIIRNAGFSAAAAILDRGSMVVLTALLSSSLAPAAFSQFGQFQLTLTMLAAFSGIGVAVSAARIFAEVDAGKPTDPSLIGTMWSLSLAAAAIMGVAAIAVAALTETGPAGLPVIPDAALFAGILFLAGGIVANGGILGLSLFGRSVLIGGVAATIALGGGWFAAQERSAAMAAWSLVAAYGATTLISSVAVIGRVGWRTIFVPPILTRGRLRAIGVLIGPLAGVSLLAALGNWLTGHILLWLAPSTLAFSGFVIGLQWYALVQFLPGMLSRAVFPLLVRTNATTDFRRMLIFSTAGSLTIAFLVTAAITVSSPLIANFYDKRAIADGAIVAAFAFAALPQSIVNMIANALIVHNKQAVWLYLSIFWFVVQTISTTLLAHWNAFGAAAAMFVAGLAMMLAAWWFARREGLL